MRLATIDVESGTAAAVILSDGSALVLEALAARNAGLPPEVSSAFASGSMHSLIVAGPAAVEAAAAAAAEAEAGRLKEAVRPAESVRLRAPLPWPAKNVVCVGRNYAEHIAEGERAQNIKIGITEHPVFFTKPATAVIGPGETIPIFPHLSTKVDYEVELAVVIGKAGRDIPAERAFEHIFGYTIVNDVTARDIQRRHGGQFFKGKALDGSCPMGPWIVTADAVPDPANLGIRLWVNDELRQDSNTGAMIFDIPTLIASMSEGMTVEPGDVLATGTPSGVGYAMEPPGFLKDGDVVTCEIDAIGRLENPVRIEEAARRVA
jgi:2-keto-4-pentenoate hydratase/2-oxohepta-3-ene-1,7-dioic acid hydratase in catechol pathway